MSRWGASSTSSTSPVSWTTPSSWSSRTTVPAAKADPTALQRMELLQRRPRLHRGLPCSTSTSSAAPVVQPLQHRLGLGLRHALPLLEALGRLRGWHRRPVPRRMAEGNLRPARGPRSVRPRRRPRTDALRPARHRAARGDQGLPAEPHRGRELRRALTDASAPGKGDAVLLDARPAGDLPRGLAGEHACTRRSPGGATSTRTNGSCTTSRRTVRRAQSRGQDPDRLSS